MVDDIVAERLAGDGTAVEQRRGIPRDAAALFDGSTVARQAFGDDVVDHYVNAARVELAAFDAAVTDWERIRSFERM